MPLTAPALKACLEQPNIQQCQHTQCPVFVSHCGLSITLMLIYSRPETMVMAGILMSALPSMACR